MKSIFFAFTLVICCLFTAYGSHAFSLTDEEIKLRITNLYTDGPYSVYQKNYRYEEELRGERNAALRSEALYQEIKEAMQVWYVKLSRTKPIYYRNYRTDVLETMILLGIQDAWIEDKFVDLFGASEASSSFYTAFRALQAPSVDFLRRCLNGIRKLADNKKYWGQRVYKYGLILERIQNRADIADELTKDGTYESIVNEIQEIIKKVETLQKNETPLAAKRSEYLLDRLKTVLNNLNDAFGARSKEPASQDLSGAKPMRDQIFGELPPLVERGLQKVVADPNEPLEERVEAAYFVLLWRMNQRKSIEDITDLIIKTSAVDPKFSGSLGHLIVDLLIDKLQKNPKIDLPIAVSCLKLLTQGPIDNEKQ